MRCCNTTLRISKLSFDKRRCSSNWYVTMKRCCKSPDQRIRHETVRFLSTPDGECWIFSAVSHRILTEGDGFRVEKSESRFRQDFSRHLRSDPSRFGRMQLMERVEMLLYIRMFFLRFSAGTSRNRLENIRNNDGSLHLFYGSGDRKLRPGNEREIYEQMVQFQNVSQETPSPTPVKKVSIRARNRFLFRSSKGICAQF